MELTAQLNFSKAIRMTTHRCDQVLNKATNKQGVLMMHKDKGQKDLEAFTSEMGVLLGQLADIQKRLKDEVMSQISSQLDCLDGVKGRCNMNKIKLVALSNNLSDSATLALARRNFNELVREIEQQDDMGLVKRLQTDVPVTREVKTFSESTQAVVNLLKQVIGQLIQSSMSADHSSGPFLNTEDNDHNETSVVDAPLNKLNGYHQPAEAAIVSPITASTPINGAVGREVTVFSLQQALDAVHLNEDKPMDLPIDFLGPMRRPKRSQPIPVRQEPVSMRPQVPVRQVTEFAETYQSLETGHPSFDVSVEDVSPVVQPVPLPVAENFYSAVAQRAPVSEPLPKVSRVEYVADTSCGAPPPTIPVSTSRRFPKPNLMDFIFEESGRRSIRTQLVLELGQKNHQEPVEEAFQFPIGCAKNPVNGDYLVCDTGHNVVKVFDTEGVPKKLCYSAYLSSRQFGFHRPSAVLCLPDMSTFVVKDNVSLQQFTFEGDVVNEFGRGQLKHPYGLARDQSGLIYTIDVISAAEQYICVYDIRNVTEMVSRVPYNCVPDRCEKSKIRFMDISGSRMVVADLGASLVYISNLKGEKIAQFGTYGRQPGQINEPSGISLDQEGNILVGDSRNDRVQLYSPEGEFICRVGMPVEIRRPSNISLTSDGELLVMNYIQHYVSVLKLLPSS